MSDKVLKSLISELKIDVFLKDIGGYGYFPRLIDIRQLFITEMNTQDYYYYLFTQNGQRACDNKILLYSLRYLRN